MPLKAINLRSAMGVIVLVLLGGCDGGNTKDISVGEHVFRVPKAHIDDYYTPWTSDGHPSGLRFIINPGAPPQEIMSVGVDPSRGTCQPSAPPISNMLEWACKLDHGAKDRSLGKFKPEKVFDRDYEIQWGYMVPDGAGGYREVAACFALSNGAALCRSINSYKNLIYSVGFRDGDIERLPEIWAKVDDLLSSWEMPSR